MRRQAIAIFPSNTGIQSRALWSTDVQESPVSLSRGRNHAIDALKGFAIIGVLVSHARFDRFSEGTQLLAEHGAQWLQWCVPAFFFAAGLLARHPEDASGLVKFLRSRGIRLLIPFVVFTLLYQATLLGAGKWNGWSWFRGGGPQLYFLTYLFAVSAATAAFMVASRGRLDWIVGLVATAIAVGAAISTPTSRTSGSDPALIALYAANYLVGVCTAVRRPGVAALLLAAGMAAASCWTGNYNLLAAGVPPIIYAILVSGFNATILRPVQWLGRWSAAIFVWHAPLLMPAASIVAVRLFGSGTGALVATLVTATSGSVLLGWFAERWSLLRPLRM